MKRVAILYSGRVQGVGFRATTAAIARDLPVTGWVRNEPDGSVRVEAQGEAEALATLRAGIRRHLGGGIRGEQVGDLPLEPGEKRFEVRHG